MLFASTTAVRADPIISGLGLSQQTTIVITIIAVLAAWSIRHFFMRGKLVLPNPDQPVGYPHGEPGLWYARFKGKNISEPDHAIRYRKKDGSLKETAVQLLEFERYGISGIRIRAWCHEENMALSVTKKEIVSAIAIDDPNQRRIKDFGFYLVKHWPQLEKWD